MPNKISEYVNVVEYGANPNSFLDDTEAFIKAIATGKSVYVPSGIYYVSETLKIENQNFVGAGFFATQIVSINTKKNEPILMAGRSCVISDMLFRYKEGIVTGDEKEGERVVIYTRSDNWPLQRGSSIRNVHIESCGTALYLPRDYIGGGPFCVDHSNLEIADFSFRGIDYGAIHRIGNIYSNIFMQSRYNVDSMIHFDGDSTNITMSTITLLYSRCKRAVISLNNVRGCHISSIHIGNVSVTEDERGFIELHNSSVEIGAFSINYIPIEAQRLSLFRIYDAGYDLCDHQRIEVKPTDQILKIVNLDICGINDPSALEIFPNFQIKGLNGPQNREFSFITRKDNSIGNYYVSIENYSYFTFQDDADIYEEFKCDDDKINFLKKGGLPLGGKTSERPKNRLCKYVTEYFDTDLGKKVIWDGEDWICK